MASQDRDAGGQWPLLCWGTPWPLGSRAARKQALTAELERRLLLDLRDRA